MQNKRFRYLLPFALIGFTLNLPIGTSDIALATKGNGCSTLAVYPAKGALYDYENPSKNSRINLRSQPSTRSQIRYVGNHNTPVTIHREILAKDGYCWFQVKVYPQKITGWVRGDLLDIYMDDI